MVNIGYINYVVALLLVTGILILYFDVEAYREEEKNKEKKTAVVIGWFNVVVGVSVFLLNWVMDILFW